MARGRGGGVKARGRGGKGGGKSSRPSTMPAQLRRSYLTGKVAQRIKWGSPHDGSRCMAQAAAHGVPKRMRGGMCQTLHRAATGTLMGQHGRR